MIHDGKIDQTHSYILSRVVVLSSIMVAGLPAVSAVALLRDAGILIGILLDYAEKVVLSEWLTASLIQPLRPSQDSVFFSTLTFFARTL